MRTYTKKFRQEVSESIIIYRKLLFQYDSNIESIKEALSADWGNPYYRFLLKSNKNLRRVCALKILLLRIAIINPLWVWVAVALLSASLLLLPIPKLLAPVPLVAFFIWSYFYTKKTIYK